MKFSKYNNPNRRRRKRYNGHSQKWIDEQRELMYRVLAEEKNDEGKDAIIKAFYVTINS